MDHLNDAGVRAPLPLKEVGWEVVDPDTIDLPNGFTKILINGLEKEGKTGVEECVLGLNVLQKAPIKNLQDAIDFMCYVSLTSHRCYFMAEDHLNLIGSYNADENVRMINVKDVAPEPIPSLSQIQYFRLQAKAPFVDGIISLLPSIPIKKGDSFTMIAWDSTGRMLGMLMSAPVTADYIFELSANRSFIDPRHFDRPWILDAKSRLYVYIHKHVQLSKVNGCPAKCDPKDSALVDGTQILFEITPTA